MKYLILLLCLCGCATPPQPIHTFESYYKYDQGGMNTVSIGDSEHICMPLSDYKLLYESYNLYYSIEGE